MARLYNLGFNHHSTAYYPAREALEDIQPGVVTLELSLFTKQIKDHIGGLFEWEVEVFDDIEHHLADMNRNSGEVTAAIVYARRNNLPVYCIDETDIPVEEVIRYNLTAIEDSRQLSNDEMDEEYFDRGTMRSRNAYMALALDFLVGLYPDEDFAHIGGRYHVMLDNPDRARPIQQLVRKFDDAEGRMIT
ncbi:MAG: hypothetical protein QGH47_00830 [Candidatus Woesearchaeota archaeon]|jgi:hypothetical protein|nr:hypothetical protein [Candidatus Woesearchaeota archaeon]